jgi:hypothetical protein
MSYCELDLHGIDVSENTDELFDENAVMRRPTINRRNSTF